MDGAHSILGHVSFLALLVIIYYFHIFRSHIRPHKADPELAIDSNAVLALSVAAQCFQMVSRRGSQEIQAVCTVEHLELSFRNGPEICEPRDYLSFEQLFGLPASE
jgi:hypothetical protein